MIALTQMALGRWARAIFVLPWRCHLSLDLAISPHPRVYARWYPIFAGGLLGIFRGRRAFYPGLMAWGAGLHKAFKKNLILIASLLLLVIGISYLLRAYLA